MNVKSAMEWLAQMDPEDEIATSLLTLNHLRGHGLTTEQQLKILDQAQSRMDQSWSFAWDLDDILDMVASAPRRFWPSSFVSTVPPGCYAVTIVLSLFLGRFKSG